MKMASLLLGMCFMVLHLHASEKLFECTKIFQERKSELLVELERIDEEKQALEALKSATEELLKKKKNTIDLEAEAVEKKLSEAKEREKNAKVMLEENKSILSKIQTLKMGKLAQTYSKIKPSSAAAILSNMPEEDAIAILQELKPKTVGQILAKMSPKKASSLTILLAK